jgi:DNA-binding CsgD family transcriptional regulator
MAVSFRSSADVFGGRRHDALAVPLRSIPRSWGLVTPQKNGIVPCGGGCEDGDVWSDLRAERIARELTGLVARELVTAELLCAVDGLVDQVVPADASCWSTFDPATTMLTSAVGRNLDEDGDDAVRYMELEYVAQAPGHYRELMSSGDPLIVQDAATARPASAEHAQVGEHLAAMGLGQELRIVLRHQRTGWGGAGLMRRTGAAPFDDDEQRFLRHVAPSITAAIRASLVRSMAEPVAIDPDRQGPAVVVVEGVEVVEATPAAQRWLEQLGAADRGHGPMPAVLAAVAVAAANGRTVAQRARTAGGTWLVVRSAPLGGHRGIVTIDEAGPPDVVAILSAALGLSARESDVVVEVLRGSSTKEIANALHLSTYTVQDHLKTVFDKAGVNSRRELIADVFLGIYAPRLGRPVGPDGFFADAAARANDEA